MAEAEGCRHQNLVGYFEQAIPNCGESCDRCTDTAVRRIVERRPKRGSKRDRERDRDRTSVAPEKPRPELEGGDVELFQRLKQLRRKLAEEPRVPAYVVFTDATLVAMAERKPTSEAELLTVSGVGLTKLARYGEQFLRVLGEGR